MNRRLIQDGSRWPSRPAGSGGVGRPPIPSSPPPHVLLGERLDQLGARIDALIERMDQLAREVAALRQEVRARREAPGGRDGD